MAYVFGFFCADGNVSSDISNCSLHIHKKDKLLLEKINSVMQSNYLITTHPDAVQLRIYNKLLCRDLMELGCLPRKSLRLSFPAVPEKFLSHFIRGFFDGDGSIHFNKPNTIKVSFTSTLSFLQTLRQRLSKTIKVNQGHIRKHYNVEILTYFGDYARTVCKWMYKSPNGLYLHRKKKRFDDHLEKRKK